MNEKIVTWEELANHSTKQNLWVLIDEKVFDVTTYLAEHPGGDDVLIKYGGLDATEQFDQIEHTDYAKSLRDARLVGAIESAPKPKDYDKKINNQRRNTNRNINQVFTWEEVEKHNKKEDLWIVIKGNVYDVTDFLDDHPGGPASFTGKAGDDASKGFDDANHSQSAINQMKDYLIGKIEGPKKKTNQGGFNGQIILFVVLALAAGYFLAIRK